MTTTRGLAPMPDGTGIAWTRLGGDRLNDSADLADSAHLAELRASLPARTEMVGGARDPRPLSALASLADRLAIPLTSIDDAGHEPWLEQPEAVRAHLRRFVRAAVAP